MQQETAKNNAAPRFSVIIPVYNVEAYLPACVKSVVEQPGAQDWECILVDDGATDTSGQMCDVFAAACPGVIALHQKNQGLAAARNTGVQAARGEWVLFLDSDDLWPAAMLPALRKTLEDHPGFDWYIAQYLELDEATGKTAPPPNLDFTPGAFESEDFTARVEKLYQSAHWSVWKYCLRRQFLLSSGIAFWPEVVWAEDWPYDLLLAKACPKLYFADFNMTIYRANRAGSLLNSNLAKHFTGLVAAQQGFARLFADSAVENPVLAFTPAQQREVWRRAANAFWPEARAAACKDKALRRACAPGVDRCRFLYDYGDQCRGRADWVLFRLLLKAFGAKFALWAAGGLKK